MEEESIVSGKKQRKQGILLRFSFFFHFFSLVGLLFASFLLFPSAQQQEVGRLRLSFQRCLNDKAVEIEKLRRDLMEEK